MLSDVVHDIPPQLLGSLLHEELAEQRERLLFCESNTGGALAFVPFSEPSTEASQQGCLLYPGKQGLNCLSILHRGLSIVTPDLTTFHFDSYSHYMRA